MLTFTDVSFVFVVHCDNQFLKDVFVNILF